MYASIRHSCHFTSEYDDNGVLVVKARLSRDRTKPRVYGKKKKTLALYHANKGLFLYNRVKEQAVITDNVKKKWEARIAFLSK